MAGVITDAHLKVLCELRELGCAVVVFEPFELGDAKAGHVEDSMIERGWDFIGGPPEGDDE